MRQHLMTMTRDIGLSVASGESDCQLLIKPRKVRCFDRVLPASFIPEQPARGRFTAVRSMRSARSTRAMKISVHLKVGLAPARPEPPILDQP
jgi:hypothetical protein